MNRRLFYLFASLLILGLLAMIPLRAAVGRLADRGFTARQVAGTIWYGRIGELNFGRRRLGTFEVTTDPAALLTGSLKLKFLRIGDPQGVLEGALISGGTQGFDNTTGRLGVSGLFGALPVDAIELDDVTILFKQQQCTTASGKVTVLLAVPIPGVDGVALRGSLRCENKRVRFALATPSGAGKLDFYIRSSGEYRAWFYVRGAAADQAVILTAAGFTPSAEGLMMSADGRL